VGKTTTLVHDEQLKDNSITNPTVVVPGTVSTAHAQQLTAEGEGERAGRKRERDGRGDGVE
jgi:hypothetical protein